jgi:hypothetical protein
MNRQHSTPRYKQEAEVLTVLRVDGAEAGGNARRQHRQSQQQRRRRRDPPPRGLLHPAANHTGTGGRRRDERWSTLFCLR